MEQMYRVGKKQNRAILTEDGNEVVVFPKGKESLAEKVCNLLNADLEINKIYSNAVLVVTSDLKENKKESEVGLPISDAVEFANWMFSRPYGTTKSIEEQYKIFKYKIGNDADGLAMLKI